MYNVLLFENNPYYISFFINNISKNISNIRFSEICYCCEDFFEMVDNSLTDIIIIDMKSLPDMLDETIKYFEKNNMYKYINSIIVIGSINYSYSSPYIFKQIVIKDNIDEVVKTLEDLLTLKKEKINFYTEIEKKIYSELFKLHYNPSYIGTKYLAESILEIYKVKDIFGGNIENKIYSILSNKYNKTTNTIYSNIKQATRNMIADCPEETIITYFGYSYFVKPKIKEVIFNIINNL